MASSSNLVRLSRNYQVAVPKTVRDQLGLKLGDVLDTSVEKGSLILRPHPPTDPGRLAAERARAGVGVSRAFDTPTELVADLHATTQRLKRTRRPR